MMAGPVKSLKTFRNMISAFLFLKLYKKIDRIESNTAYSDLQFLFLAARDGWGDGAIVEIGSFKGKSAAALALGSKCLKREKVFCVDPHFEGTKDIFLKNIADIGVADHVIPLFLTSEEAAKTFDSPIRLLFIDGDHKYESVKTDISLWKDRVIDGGIIAFHDYYWSTVSRAIDELIINSGEYIVEGTIGCTLFVSKKIRRNAELCEEVTLFNRFKKVLKRLYFNKPPRRFYSKSDYPQRIIADFIDYMKKDGNLYEDQEHIYRGFLEKYLNFTGEKRLSEAQAAEYLDRENVFIIETYLQSLSKNRISADNISSFNNGIFKDLIQKRAVTSKDYDERIKAQSFQFQVDNYYDPKDSALRRRVDIVLSFIQPKEGERILDVGCGVGTFAYHCARKGAKTAGVDYSKESIGLARRLSENFGTSANTEFTCWDASERLPYTGEYFDKVVAADFIEHIDDLQKEKVLSEILRVLKPGGVLIVFTPNGIRESLGAIKALLSKLFGAYAPETRLHYGLTNRFRFEKMLKRKGLTFTRRFFDVTRPYLARIPFLKEALSLDILWVIKKQT